MEQKKLLIVIEEHDTWETSFVVSIYDENGNYPKNWNTLIMQDRIRKILEKELNNEP